MARRLKILSNVFSGIALISFMLFFGSHYGYIDIINFQKKSYFVFILIFGLSIIINAFLEYKINILEEKKQKPLSLFIDLLLFISLMAYAIYVYKLPAGTCPIRYFFESGAFNKVDFK